MEAKTKSQINNLYTDRTGVIRLLRSHGTKRAEVLERHPRPPLYLYAKK